jgi:hypothetical protein
VTLLQANSFSPLLQFSTGKSANSRSVTLTWLLYWPTRESPLQMAGRPISAEVPANSSGLPTVAKTINLGPSLIPLQRDLDSVGWLKSGGNETARPLPIQKPPTSHPAHASRNSRPAVTVKGQNRYMARRDVEALNFPTRLDSDLPECVHYRLSRFVPEKSHHAR